MPDPQLTETMQQRVRQFCNDLAGNDGIDDDVREELETYFQDKMLGYLSREEALTEEDAFVLAREHFGDEQLVKDLLLNVHQHTSATYKRKDSRMESLKRCQLIGSILAATAVILLAGCVYGGYLSRKASTTLLGACLVIMLVSLVYNVWLIWRIWTDAAIDKNRKKQLVVPPLVGSTISLACFLMMA